MGPDRRLGDHQGQHESVALDRRSPPGRDDRCCGADGEPLVARCDHRRPPRGGGLGGRYADPALARAAQGAVGAPAECGLGQSRHRRVAGFAQRAG